MFFFPVHQVSNGDTDIKNRFMDLGRGGGQRGEKGVNGESSMKHTLPDVKQYQWAFAVWPRALKQPRGWGGVAGGREVPESMYTYG